MTPFDPKALIDLVNRPPICFLSDNTAAIILEAAENLESTRTALHVVRGEAATWQALAAHQKKVIEKFREFAEYAADPTSTILDVQAKAIIVLGEDIRV